MFTTVGLDRFNLGMPKNVSWLTIESVFDFVGVAVNFAHGNAHTFIPPASLL